MKLPIRIASMLGVVLLLALIPIRARRTTGSPLPSGPPTRAEGGGPSSEVAYFSSQQVRDAFAKGAALVAPSASRNYSVLAMRRDRPSEAETHTLDTDIFYVVDGSATFVTGGRAVDSKTTAPNEMRGTRIDGGETRHLAKGDVLVIPPGVPHWFKAVEPPFLYYVIKVRR